METLDIMCDLETLAKVNSSAIIQIAAVAFDLSDGSTFGQFDVKVSPQSSVKYGLQCDGDTVQWWLAQDQKVIENVLVQAILNGKDLKETLIEFNKFINDLKTKYEAKNVVVWGNGMLADNKWLLSAYDACGVTPAWSFRDDRDIRTFIDIGQRILETDHKSSTPFVGEKHNAIHDCLHQIKYCVKIFSAFRKANKTDKWEPNI